MDENSTVQNCGVTLEVKSMKFFTLKDTNHVVGSMTYYSIIEAI